MCIHAWRNHMELQVSGSHKKWCQPSCDQKLIIVPSACHSLLRPRQWRTLCMMYIDDNVFHFVPIQLNCQYLFIQSLADNCFPTNQGHSASRLHGMLLAIWTCQTYCWIIDYFLMEVYLQNFSCVSFVMLIHAQGGRSPSLGVAR